MSTKYVVRIRLLDKTWRYLRLYRPGPWKMTEWRLVRSATAATRLDSELVAEALSDEFWRAHWDRERYNERAVRELKPRKEAS